MKLRVHPVFWIVLFLAGLTGHGIHVFLVFISVLLHETAHAVVAWAFSYSTLRIDLYPFGGVALVDSALGGDPIAEACTALAGPLYSLFLAVLAHYGGEWMGGGDLWPTIRSINTSLGLFNLIPLYPLDGGRVVRALLAHVLGLRDATRKACIFTRWAVGISLAPTVFLWIKGVIPWTIPFVQLFLWIAARDPKDDLYLRWRQGERRRRQLEDGKTLPVAFQIINQRAELGEAEMAVEGRAYSIILTADDEGHVKGWVDEATFWRVLMDRGGYQKSVGSVSQKVSAFLGEICKKSMNIKS